MYSHVAMWPHRTTQQITKPHHSTSKMKTDIKICEISRVFAYVITKKNLVQIISVKRKTDLIYGTQLVSCLLTYFFIIKETKKKGKVAYISVFLSLKLTPCCSCGESLFYGTVLFLSLLIPSETNNKTADNQNNSWSSVVKSYAMVEL